MLTTVECSHCEGKGHHLDSQYSRQRLHREVKRTCRTCKGSGRVAPRDDRPLWQRQEAETTANPPTEQDVAEALRLIYGE